MPHGQSTSQRPSILVLYGSETGNSQDIAEEIGRSAERFRFETSVEELDAVQLVCFDTNPLSPTVHDH